MAQLRLAPIVGVIPTVKDVVLQPFPADDPSTPKGSNTWNLPYPAAATAGRTMVARRRPDDQVGNHFHPRTRNKDPERFLLIAGRIEFWFRDTEGGGRLCHMDAHADGPLEISIPPYVLHGLRVHSGPAWFLEQQTGKFDPSVNYSPEEFDLLCRTLAQK